jgi:hypothetical protein
MGYFKDKEWFKEKLVGTALCSAAGGMILIIILPKVSLGIILAFIIFMIGIWLICCC